MAGFRSFIVDQIWYRRLMLSQRQLAQARSVNCRCPQRLGHIPGSSLVAPGLLRALVFHYNYTKHSSGPASLTLSAAFHAS